MNHDFHWALLAGAFFCVACGGGGSPADGNGGGGGSGGALGGSGGSAGGAGGSGDLACGVQAATTAPDDVSGKWAMLDVAARLAEAPTFSELIPNRAVTLAVLEQTQTGSEVAIEGEVCDHWVSDPDDALVKTLIPEAYLLALPPISATGSYEVGDDGVGHYTIDEEVLLIGMELDNPKTDPLPTEPDDPGVVDADQDGNPGVTVFLTGVVQGDLHVVSRRVSTVSAVATADDRIEGRLDFDARENILASEPGSIKELGTSVSPDRDECKSSVTLVRVPDDADCAAVIARYSELFPGGVPRVE